MNPSIDPLSQMLGEINAKLEMVLKTQSEDRTASASYRTDMRNSLSEVNDKVSDLRNRTNSTEDELAHVRTDGEKAIAAVNKRVDAIEVDTDDYRMRKHEAQGVGKFTKILWAVFSALGLGGLIALLEKLRH